MNEKYIRKSGKSFYIYKNNKNYGKFADIEDAVFIRDELILNNWDVSKLKEIYRRDDTYIAIGIIDSKVKILLKSCEKPSPDKIDKIYKKHLRNPNNSRYGLNISKIFDTFVIKKRIAGDDYIFGYYESLSDAEFVRNFLLENNWNVNAFSKIQYDNESELFHVVEVIDDKVYVLKSSTNNDFNLNEVYRNFLSKISKHRLGLSNHDYLTELCNKTEELEERFNVRTEDDVWNLKNTTDPLNDIIFTLTPFQKSVYDAADNSTFEDIKKSLIRFKSKNFEAKIEKNLNELMDMNLIFKKQNCYIRRKQ